MEADDEETISIIPIVEPSCLVATLKPKVVALAAPYIVSSPIHAPRYQPSTLGIPTLPHKSYNMQTLSQILAIPRCVSIKAKKKTSTLHCHGRHITTEAFQVEIKEKEDNEVAKTLALEHKRKAKKDQLLKRRRKK